MSNPLMKEKYVNTATFTVTMENLQVHLCAHVDEDGD